MAEVQLSSRCTSGCTQYGQKSFCWVQTIPSQPLELVFVNGGDSTEYDRATLTGTLAPGAYTVVAKDAQNGAPDGLALIDTNTGDLLDALSYEGAITAAVIGSTTYSLVEGTVLPDTVADSNGRNGSKAGNG